MTTAERGRREAAGRSIVDATLRANRRYARQDFPGLLPIRPARRLAVLTCMDPRLNVEEMLGLRTGDAHVIRNAGGVATEDAIRSLIISHYLLGTQEWMVIHHTRCEMLAFKDDPLRHMLETQSGTSAVAPVAFHSFRGPVEELDAPPTAGQLDRLRVDVRRSVTRITSHPWFPSSPLPVRGFIYNVDDGLLQEVTGTGFGTPDPLPPPSRGKVVVANRGAGTISAIDAYSDEVVATVSLETGPEQAEPMYLTHVAARNRLFVGDRRNSQVAVLDAGDLTFECTVPTDAGIWHMWPNHPKRQLWVTCDVDNTITVIDTHLLTVIDSIGIPTDLVEEGGKPHDITLDPAGAHAYVTLFSVAGPSDVVVKYSTRTFREVGRASVGKEPHIFFGSRQQLLYVPCQGSNQVVVLRPRDLRQIAVIPAPGAHGAEMAPDGDVFYTTNVPGGGADGIIAIATKSNEVLGTTPTPFAMPHNLAILPEGDKLYLTHSGETADKVTIYNIATEIPLPVLAGQVTAGTNPFGLLYVP